MTAACEPCLRRSWLLGRLAGPIAARIEGWRRTRAGAQPAGHETALLELADEELIQAVAPVRGAELAEELAAVDPAALGERARLAGLRAVCRHAEVYPAPLAATDDAPAVLFCAGKDDLGDLLAMPSVAIVGTRAPSPYGLEIATRLGRDLGAAGVTVVSGLALGIDAAAHRGCLDGGGRPLAVLACGADVPYPRRHARLYGEVTAAGLAVAELPPGEPPRRWTFPARNRIMAGIAAMTVVVEAADPSGSLITARVAARIGRSVGAVPGRVNSRVAAGSNGLLHDGARMVRGAQDVLDELFGVGTRELPRAGPELRGGDLSLLDGIEAGLDLSAACERAGVGAGAARAGLARLELGGWVRRTPLGGYVRTGRPL